MLKLIFHLKDRFEREKGTNSINLNDKKQNS